MGVGILKGCFRLVCAGSRACVPSEGVASRGSGTVGDVITVITIIIITIIIIIIIFIIIIVDNGRRDVNALSPSPFW